MKLALIGLVAFLPAVAVSTEAEKLVDREGKILYYLQPDGRVVRPDGSVAGYMKPDRSLVKPNGERQWGIRNSKEDSPRRADADWR